MKTRLLPLLVLFAALTGTAARAESGPKLIQSYTDVLAVIPEEFAPQRVSQWTEMKKSALNAILKENVVDPHTRAKFQATVSQVANWPDLTLFWEVPNPEGCHIRVFAHFTDDWKARLSMLNIGDPVTIEGTFFKVDFENLWGDSTLCLCISDCTFTKEATTNDQSNAAPAVRETTAHTASAISPSVLDSAPSSIASPAAKVVVDSSHGAMTFASSDQPSDARGFELVKKDWTVEELSDSLKGAAPKYGDIFAEPVWNDTTGTFTFTNLEPYPASTTFFETSMIRGVTFQAQPGNSVQVVLITDPPSWCSISEVMLTNTATP